MRYLGGIENLDAVDHVLKGKKLGLLTNFSGIDSKFNSDVDILNSRYDLIRLFAPEHGLRGELQAGEKVSSYIDEKTGIEVVSLYGSPADGVLDRVECLLYDIQDVGVRHFSYPYLMAKMMKKCAEKGIPFVVLDRYNPLGLSKISGNIYDDKFQCDVGGYSLATRYAMTVGELARYVNAEYNVNCELYVAPCVGIDRSIDHYELSTHWIPPSPNCPTFDTVLCYVGNVLFEGTNVSEGRGTTKPFELIGAPWLKNEELVEKIRKARLNGFSHYMVVVAEGAASGEQVSTAIREATDLDPRVTVLGHIQRGGDPTARDRVAATKMGYLAVDLLKQGLTNRIVCTRDGGYTHVDMDEGLATTKQMQRMEMDVLDAMTGL